MSPAGPAPITTTGGSGVPRHRRRAPSVAALVTVPFASAGHALLPRVAPGPRPPAGPAPVDPAGRPGDARHRQRRPGDAASPSAARRTGTEITAWRGRCGVPRRRRPSGHREVREGQQRSSRPGRPRPRPGPTRSTRGPAVKVAPAITRGNVPRGRSARRSRGWCRSGRPGRPRWRRRRRRRGRRSQHTTTRATTSSTQGTCSGRAEVVVEDPAGVVDERARRGRTGRRGGRPGSGPAAAGRSLRRRPGPNRGRSAVPASGASRGHRPRAGAARSCVPATSAGRPRRPPAAPSSTPRGRVSAGRRTRPPRPTTTPGASRPGARPEPRRTARKHPIEKHSRRALGVPHHQDEGRGGEATAARPTARASASSPVSRRTSTYEQGGGHQRRPGWR